jgi:hypothetical protein
VLNVALTCSNASIRLAALAVAGWTLLAVVAIAARSASNLAPRRGRESIRDLVSNELAADAERLRARLIDLGRTSSKSSRR